MRTWLALVVVAGLWTGACSSSTETTPGNATPEKTIKFSISAIPGVGWRPASDLSRIDSAATGDLDAVLARGYLRVLVAGSRGELESRKGEIRGGTVDTGVAIETALNQRIAPKKIAVVFIATTEDALIPDLLAGKGDVAANVMLTFERDDQVAFAKPVRTNIQELIVNGPKESHVVSLEDAGGRSIHVRRLSDHAGSLVRLNGQLEKIARPQARIVYAPGLPSDEDLLEQVNAGKIPATIAYDYVYDACCGRLPGLKTNRDVAVSQGGIQAWVTRKDAPNILAFLNEFFSTHALMRGVP